MLKNVSVFLYIFLFDVGYGIGFFCFWGCIVVDMCVYIFDGEMIGERFWVVCGFVCLFCDKLMVCLED